VPHNWAGSAGGEEEIYASAGPNRRENWEGGSAFDRGYLTPHVTVDIKVKGLGEPSGLNELSR